MNNRDDLKEMYQKGEKITICPESWMLLTNGKTKVLEHHVKGMWLEVEPPVEDYKNYDYLLCNYHHEELNKSTTM